MITTKYSKLTFSIKKPLSVEVDEKLSNTEAILAIKDKKPIKTAISANAEDKFLLAFLLFSIFLSIIL